MWRVGRLVAGGCGTKDGTNKLKREPIIAAAAPLEKFKRAHLGRYVMCKRGRHHCLSAIHPA